MSDIPALLKLARRRLELTRFLGYLHVAVLVVAAAALALAVADRIGARPFVPWWWMGPALGGAALIAAAALWSRRRLSELQVAVAVDERLDLREKMSTSLHCRGRDDAFARAALEDAVHIARDPRTRARARRAIVVAAPSNWWISPVLLLAVLAASWLPQFSFWSDTPEPDSIAQTTHAQARQAVEVVINEIKQNEQLAQSMADLLGELSQDPLSGQDVPDPADVRRDALKKVSELHERLESILRGEQGSTASAMEKALQQLQAPEDGPAREFADALSKGDFKAAQQALENITKAAQSGEMSPQQQQQLAQQMQALADQLNDLAQQQQALEQALRQAGMDPQLAKNPAALQQALQNNQNLNQQQQQQLQQMCQAQQQCQRQMQGLGQLCQQMAQGMQQGQMGQAGQAGQKMGQMLSNMEAMQQMMQMAQAAAGQCRSQAAGLGQNLARNMQSAGGAFGDRGQGAGGEAPKQKTPTKTRLELDPGRDSGEQDVIFRQFVQGENIVGESKARLRAVVTTAAEGLKQGVAEDQIPLKYHPAHQHYFGQLQKLIDGSTAPAAAAAPKSPVSGSGASGS